MSFADAVELREHLAQVLQPYLGEWEDGSPRVHIKPPEPTLKGLPKVASAEEPIAATTQSEVECIIRRVPAGRPQQMSAGQRFRETVYLVRFVNYADDTKLTNLLDAFHADSRIQLDRETVVIDADTQSYEQASAYVRVNEVFNQVVYTPA